MKKSKIRPLRSPIWRIILLKGQIEDAEGSLFFRGAKMSKKCKYSIHLNILECIMKLRYFLQLQMEWVILKN